MTRNLDFRIEVITPIFDEKIKKQLLKILELQWSDTVKARLYNDIQNNPFRKMPLNEKPIRSQDAIYDFWKDFSVKKKR